MYLKAEITGRNLNKCDSQLLFLSSWYSLNKKSEYVHSLRSEFQKRVNLEWTFVLFTHFGVTSLGIPEWSLWSLQNEVNNMNNTNVHSKFTPNSL